MAVSTISAAGQEGFVVGTATFIRSGVLYIASTVVSSASGQRRLQWKPHTSGNFTEVFGELAGNLQRYSIIHNAVADRLLVVWDEDTDAGEDGGIYSAILNPTTGATITDRTLVAPKGRSPSLAYTGGVISNDFTLGYVTRTTGQSYIRQTLDGGVTWGDQQPVLNGKVARPISVSVVSYDEKHVTLAQVGSNARTIDEVSAYQRTRPLGGIILHPTIADRVYVCESSWASVNTDPEDKVRGGLAISRDNSMIWNIRMDRLGTDDSIGILSLFGTASNTLSLVSSNSVGGVASAYIEGRPVGATVGASTYDLPASSSPGAITELAVGKDLVFTVSRIDALTGGFFYWVNPLLATSGAIGSSEGRFGISIDTTSPSSNGVIVVGRRDFALSAYFVDIYDENGTSPPILRNSHRMPAKINALKLVLDSTSSGLIYVGMEDRLNIYRLNGMTSPVRLLSSFKVITRGRFHQIQTTPSGYIVAAMGAGGVGVFNPAGRMVGQSNPSNIGGVTSWMNNTAYALNRYVTPRSDSPYAQRYHYFKCTTAGTSGTYQPIWPTSGTVTDGTAVWTYQGSTVASICGVVVEPAFRRIIAVGNVDGDAGVNGKIWILKTKEAL